MAKRSAAKLKRDRLKAYQEYRNPPKPEPTELEKAMTQISQYEDVIKQLESQKASLVLELYQYKRLFDDSKRRTSVLERLAQRLAEFKQAKSDLETAIECTRTYTGCN